ncbi:MAG: type II toxin-antitoxin system VapB family antitoxin [Ferrovibrio sp.]
MGLNIKNAETVRLIEELATLTGESKTAALTAAVRERIEQERRKRSRAARIDDMLRISRESAAHFKEPYKSIEHGDLLYDDKGLPK